MGQNLILQARKLSNLDNIVKELKQYNVDIILKECNLEDIADVTNMLESIQVEVDRVVNNAGIQIGYNTDFLNSDYETFLPQFKVNTITPLFITYHFLKKLDGKEGYIVNVTSGINHEPEQPAYSGSKAALDKVTQDLAFRYKDTNITISLADPGWCRTDLGGPMAPNSKESTIPGMILGLFSKKCNGRIIHAQDYTGLSLVEAIKML